MPKKKDRRYLPKSKIQVKITSGGELEYIHNAENYIGYYIETSDGHYYEGRHNANFGKELRLIRKTNFQDSEFGEFGDEKDVRKFNIINESTKKYLEKTKAIPSQKTKPNNNNLKN